MFKALSALFLCLSLNVQAQSVTANTCVDLGNILYGIAQEKLQGKPIKQQFAEMHEALDGSENAALIPFFESKINEAYQTKKKPEQFGQDFINDCFKEHGDLSKLIGKKV